MYQRLLCLFITTLIPCANAFAQAPGWIIDWTSSDGHAGQFRTSPVEKSEGGRRLLILAVESPMQAPKSVEQRIADQWVRGGIQGRAPKWYLLLSQSAGQFRVTSSSGEQVIYTYKLRKGPPLLRISPSCQGLNPQVRIRSQAPSQFPALLSCILNGREVQEVVFSSTADSEWFGSGVFEAGGKGERWKSFAAKDIITLPSWEFSWGSAEQKTTAQIVIPKPPPKPPPQSPFSFRVGLQYLTGSVQGAGQSSALSGVQVPLSVQYQKEKSWWFLGTGYDFFAVATQSASAGSNSTTDLSFWSGAEHTFAAFKIRGRLGYLSRSVNAPGVQTSATFDAPLLGFDGIYQRGDQSFGLSLQYAQTSNQGQYTETAYSVFYQNQLLWHRQTRFGLSQTQLQGTSSGADFGASWIGVGVGLQF